MRGEGDNRGRICYSMKMASQPSSAGFASNNLTDVPGVRVGHAATPNGLSGCTVIDFPGGGIAGMDVRGGGAGTRQTDSLRAYHIVQRIDAICLSGGSALGLGCAQGVVDALREQGRGTNVRGFFIPIVPAAILFDLFVSNGDIPGPAQGREALLSAGYPAARGSVGAGLGAAVGKWHGITGAMRGGLGMMSAKLGDVTVGVLAVVNAFGDILAEDGSILAGARDPDVAGAFTGTERMILDGRTPVDQAAVSHTNLIVAVTDAALGREDVRHFAALAHNGVTVAVRPAHLTFDGDVCFGVSTGLSGETVQVDRLGVLAGKLVEAAVRDAVRSAISLPQLPSAGKRNS